MNASSIIRDWSLYLMGQHPAEVGDTVFLCNPNFPMFPASVESVDKKLYRFEMGNNATQHYSRGVNHNDYTCYFYRRNGEWLAM